MQHNQNGSGDNTNKQNTENSQVLQGHHDDNGQAEDHNERQTEERQQYDDEDANESKRNRNNSYNDDNDLDNTEYREDSEEGQPGGQRGINMGGNAGGGSIAPGRDTFRQDTPGQQQGFNGPGINSDEKGTGDTESADFTARRPHEEPEHQFNATPEGNSFTLREQSPDSSEGEEDTSDLEGSGSVKRNGENS